jgi:hypothetical protein
MNDTTATDDDGVEPEQPQPLSVGDPDLGKTRLLTRSCDTCIFLKGNRMSLSPGRLRQLVDQARREGGYIVCHSTLPHYRSGTRPAICRGFADRYSTWQLQVIARLWGFVELDPPPCDEHQPHTKGQAAT